MVDEVLSIKSTVLSTISSYSPPNDVLRLDPAVDPPLSKVSANFTSSSSLAFAITASSAAESIPMFSI